MTDSTDNARALGPWQAFPAASTDNARGPDLLPCPFCGSTKIEADNNAHNPFYICKGCNAYGPNGLAAWNTRADLAAPSPAVKVKPLEWVELGDRWNTVTAGRIQITQYGCSPNWDLSCASPAVDGYFDTLESAKAAAQADYEARILSALEPAAPSPDVLDDPRVQRLSQKSYDKGLEDALGVIASLGYGKNEDVDEGHEEAFRAIEAHRKDWALHVAALARITDTGGKSDG